jgi:hypothetical protein
MNLQRIRPALPVQTLLTRCERCKGVVRSDTGFADLDGPPFKAYYCAVCAVDAQNNVPVHAFNPGLQVEVFTGDPRIGLSWVRGVVEKNAPYEKAGCGGAYVRHAQGYGWFHDNAIRVPA